MLKTYGKDFDVATSGHRVTSRLPVLRLRHLCRTYNNDDPSTSNSYASLPYITEQGEFRWTSNSPPHPPFWPPQP